MEPANTPQLIFGPLWRCKRGSLPIRYLIKSYFGLQIPDVSGLILLSLFWLFFSSNLAHVLFKNTLRKRWGEDSTPFLTYLVTSNSSHFSRQRTWRFAEGSLMTGSSTNWDSHPLKDKFKVQPFQQVTCSEGHVNLK